MFEELRRFRGDVNERPTVDAMFWPNDVNRLPRAVFYAVVAMVEHFIVEERAALLRLYLLDKMDNLDWKQQQTASGSEQAPQLSNPEVFEWFVRQFIAPLNNFLSSPIGFHCRTFSYFDVLAHQWDLFCEALISAISREYENCALAQHLHIELSFLFNVLKKTMDFVDDESGRFDFYAIVRFQKRAKELLAMLQWLSQQCKVIELHYIKVIYFWGVFYDWQTAIQLVVSIIIQEPKLSH